MNAQRQRWRTALRTSRILRPIFRGEGAAIGGLLILIVVSTAAEILRPWPLKLILDDLTHGDLTGQAVTNACLVVLALALIAGILNLARSLVLARVGRRVVTRLRRLVFEHIQRLNFVTFREKSTGDLLARIGADVNQVRDLFLATTSGLLERGLLIAGTVAFMAWTDWRITLVTLAPLPLLAWLLRSGGRKLREVSRRQRRKETEVQSLATNALLQIRLVKALGAEGATAHELAHSARSGERALGRAAVLAAKLALSSELLASLGLAALLFFGVIAVRDGRITAGDLLLLASWARALGKPLRGLTKEGVRFARSTASAERVLETLGWPTEARGAGKPVPTLRGDIEVQGLTLQWPGRPPVLLDATFTIPADTRVLITGPNGAGKSTFAAALLRLLDPIRGRILIGGEDITTLDLDQFRARIGYVPQELHHLGTTIGEDLRLGAPAASEDQLWNALAQVDLETFVRRLPEGLDTPIGEGGRALSGGESRRLMLARAALRGGDLLILDEPLSGIDQAAKRPVGMAIRQLALGRTTLVISHEEVPHFEATLPLAIEDARLVPPTVEVGP